MKQLKPQPLKQQYAEPTRKRLDRLFYDILFRQIIDAIKDTTAQKALLNADVGIIAKAITTGRLQYIDGIFIGQLSSTLGRQLRAIGAIFDKTQKVYKIPPRLLPSDLRAAIAFADTQAKILRDNLRDVLRRTEEQLNFHIGRAKVVKPATVKEISTDFQKAAKAISVAPQISIEAQAKIADQYNENMKLYIKDFAVAEIKELRDIVESNTMEGGRYPDLISGIKARYGVTQNKAKFLARQETALMMSTFRKERLGELGVTHYRWSAVPSARPDHKALDGKVFAYNNPPVTDRASGARNNPGQDYNCFPWDSGIDFAYGIKKGFRRWYTGEVSFLVLDSGKTIRATPNHPVLTLRGWKPIGSLKQGDYVIDISDELAEASKTNGDEGIAAIGKIFESLRKAFGSTTLPGQRKQFHGDGSDRNINIVDTAWGLLFKGNTQNTQSIKQFPFPQSVSLTLRQGGLGKHLGSLFFRYLSSTKMRGNRQSLKLAGSHTRKSDDIGLATIANRNTILDKSAPNDSTLETGTLCNGQFALAGNIGVYDRLSVKLKAITNKPSLASLNQRKRVIHNFKTPFDDYVYNLETTNNHYTTNGVVVSNCRCVDVPILK